LLRGKHLFPEAFFDLAREPVRQGCGIDIGHTPFVHVPGSCGQSAAPVEESVVFHGARGHGTDQQCGQTVRAQAGAMAQFLVWSQQ